MVVLLPNHDIEEASAAASRIRRAIEAARIEKIENGITASLGVATFPYTASDVTRLFEQADSAVYISKDSGRNKVTIATASYEFQPTDRKTLSPADSFADHLLSETRSLLEALTYIQRDFIRLLLTRGSCENHLAVSLANVSDNLVLDAFVELPERGIVERNEDLNRSALNFSINDHW